MEHTYWLKQTSEPLFPDILWSRPETKMGAGKLAIFGGNLYAFGAAGAAYSAALDGGAGVIRALLPDSVKKVVKLLLPDASFCPSTPSGSFSIKSIGDMLETAAWSDCVLLAGDFGRNSETAMVLEKFVHDYTGPLVVTHDAVDYFKESPLQLLDRPGTVVGLSLSQLQKAFINTPSITPILLSMSSLQLAEALHDYTKKHPACILTKHNDLIFVAYNGQVSTTKHSGQIWRVETSARAAVFWLQNLQNTFESITTSIVET